MEKEIVVLMTILVLLSTHGSNIEDTDNSIIIDSWMEGSVYDTVLEDNWGVNLFYENKGQYDKILGQYCYERSNLLIGFKENEVVVLTKGFDSVNMINYRFITHREVTPSGQLPLTFETHRFLGDSPDGWVRGIHSYREIIYREIWDGIDLRYHISEEGPKYEFIVRPDGNPAEITVRVGGCQNLSLVDQHMLSIKSSHDVITDGPLEVFYQHDTDDRIGAHYSIRGCNEFGYVIDEYDRSRTIVIDPLIYSKLIGGMEMDLGTSISVDKDGNAFIAGCTNSFDFFNTSTIGNIEDKLYYNIFIMKIDKNGEDILFSTIIGGSDSEFINDMTVDDTGAVVITGYTNSVDFPITSSNRSSEYYSSDVFICRLSGDGSRLLWSIIVGGQSQDIAYGMAITQTGDIFIVGETLSEDFPITSMAYEDQLGSSMVDTFILSVSSDGKKIISSTFFGGVHGDIGYDIDIDSNGDVYICGATNSPNFPITQDALRKEFKTGTGNIFISKFDTNLSTLEYSTFIVTSTLIMDCSIDVDVDGNAFLAGSTDSDDLPTTSSAFQTVRRGGSDAFICKLNENGTSLLYATYIGGDSAELTGGLRIDQYGYAYLTGRSHSFDFPVTTGSLREDNDVVNGDVFICKINQNGTSLSYWTFAMSRGLR